MGELERLERELRACGGVVSARWLAACGVGEDERRRLERIGELRTVRRGWYAASGAVEDAVRAVTVGGALSCVSALERFGVWRPTRDGLHVRFARTPAAARGVHPHALPRRLAVPVTAGIDGPLRSLACATRCLRRNDAVAVLDSALERSIVGMEELEQMAGSLGPGAAAVLDLVEPGAGSGIETRVRLMLRRRRIRFRTQVLIAGLGIVDFLIGDRLILEVDGAGHHTSPSSFLNDRRRDGVAVELGFLTVRTTYREVMDDLPALERRILAIVRADDHLWSVRNARWRGLGGGDPVRFRAAG